MSKARINNSVDFFLGALSPSGFTGWFEQASRELGCRALLIKSGPGCGKSTFLKQIAASFAETETAAPIQRIHCSSDPASLDGVLLPQTGAFLFDATAPHTLDCVYPGAQESVVSLYHTLDDAKLFENRHALLDAGARNTALLHQAAAHFAQCCALLQQRTALCANAVDAKHLRAFALALATRLMPKTEPKTGTVGNTAIRLLSAPTPDGLTVFYDTIPVLASHIYAIHDAYGAVSGLLLRQLAALAKQRGYDVIECRCPTNQAGKIDHLFIPALGLAFVTANSWHPMVFASQHNIHASRFIDYAQLSCCRAQLNFEKRVAATLLENSYELLAAARNCHDELEKFYIAATDFSAVESERRRLQTVLMQQAGIAKK